MLKPAVVAPTIGDWPELSGAVGPVLAFVVLLVATLYFLGGPSVFVRRDAAARMKRFDTQMAKFKTHWSSGP